MSDTVDVAVIGAGPYGLSLAAYLRAAGVDYRHFGIPMRLWRSAMPQGMLLKSEGFASNISDPGGTYTLEAFCKATSRPYASSGLPIPLDTFVSYGQWFQSGLDLAVEEVLVTGITQRDGGFELNLGGVERVLARKVVVATGVEHFAYVPESLSALPSDLCTHSSAHSDLAAFRGQEVIVVGAGASALESAALLHENGVAVQLLVRKGEVRWGRPSLPMDRPLLQRLRKPTAGLGYGWPGWFYSYQPDLFRQVPQRIRASRSAIAPAGGWWLRDRVEGQFPVMVGHAVTWAKPQDGRVRLGVTTPGGAGRELEADHVIAATGYRIDLTRMAFLPEEIRSRLRTVVGSRSPAVGRDYQSSVPGLYFVGAAVAPTFGPLMRHVLGTWHASPVVARHVAVASGRTSQPAPVASR
jgi:FAD-dependent urate hydroxylase